MIQKFMLIPIIIYLSLTIGCGPSEDEQTIGLNHAKPYTVLGEGSLANDLPERTVGLWFITAAEADTFGEYAQTAIQAVRDLYRLYERDFTSVLLIPNDELEYALYYAQAFYAADGKGSLGMTGSVTAKEKYWFVRATDRPLTEQELAIAELWWAKIPDFPNNDPISSLSYDEEALRQYVADTLNIPYAEVIFPQIDYTEYEYDERL
jgi:hypothetical protein